MNFINIVLNDIYWSSYKNNLTRVIELAEEEGIDIRSASNDPWEVCNHFFFALILLSTIHLIDLFKPSLISHLFTGW